MTPHEFSVDDYVREPDREATAASGFVFRITAGADVDVLGRIANTCGLANRAPSRASLRALDEERVVIDIELRDIDLYLADLIRRKLMQLTCVIDVNLQRLD